MALISRRECHLVEVKNEDLNRFVDEIQAYLKEKQVPSELKINVYKDAVACCGYFPTGVTIEIEGPANNPISEMDSMIYAKIIEICERERIEYHECKPLETLEIDG